MNLIYDSLIILNIILQLNFMFITSSFIRVRDIPALILGHQYICIYTGIWAPQKHIFVKNKIYQMKRVLKTTSNAQKSEQRDSIVKLLEVL